MANDQLARFMGGTPAAVFFRLILLSILVGVVLSAVGLDPWKADVIMVKNFFPFLLFFLPMNRKTIFVRTRGVTDFDAAFGLTFDGPVHPRDHVEDWRARDRERRGAVG